MSYFKIELVIWAPDDTTQDDVLEAVWHSDLALDYLIEENIAYSVERVTDYGE